jgi:uncharacterized membrane protein HdeD (DUF308 family)
MPIGLPADTAQLRAHSTWFIVYGIVMALMGLFAIAIPGIATLAVSLTIGWVLLIGGGFGIVAVISSGRAAPGFWWNLVTAIVCILAGLSMLFRPVSGVITLTIILAAYLLASGVGHLMLAIGYRKDIPNAWMWMAFSGVVDIVLGFIIISGMPGTAIWVLGVLVGINLLMAGIALIMAAVAVRKAAAATA